MARFITSFLVLAFLAPSLAFAQIKLNSSGYTSVGSTSPSSSYRLRVIEPSNVYIHTALYSAASGVGYQGTGIKGYASGNYINYGVYGEATASGGSTNYGIFGKATGGSTNWAGYFQGSVYTTGSYQSSDQRFKKNIRQLPTPEILDKIMQLNPRSYEFLDNEELKSRRLPALNARGGTHVGLLAQEVEQLFPELVVDVVSALELSEEQINNQETPQTITTKAINYQELTVLLLAAIQQQQVQIEQLKAALNARE